MAVFDIFRRHSIRAPAALGVFIDEQALLLAQKIVQDYSRLRAGPDSKAPFLDPEIRTAIERARWQAYPVALSMIGEMVEGALRPHSGATADAVLGSLLQLLLATFDRKSVPATMTAVGWRTARQEMSGSLNGLTRNPVKYVNDVAESFSGLFLALMPIHEKLQRDDFPALRSGLKVLLGEIHEKLTKRADLPALAKQLAVETA